VFTATKLRAVQGAFSVQWTAEQGVCITVAVLPKGVFYVPMNDTIIKKKPPDARSTGRLYSIIPQ